MKSNLPEPLPPEFAEPLARSADRRGSFGRRIVWYREVPSTNDVAAALAEQEADEGCVVAANAQSAGRGRHGRRWISPAGAGLYVSAVLRPQGHAAPLVTIAAGVAIADGVQQATGLQPGLKWPNDLYVAGRKVAGVLAEASAHGDSIQYVILGFGINVLPAAYPAEIAGLTTSLEEELGRQVDRGLLLAECLSSLALRYGELQAGRLEGVVDALRRRAAPTRGRRVRWEGNGTVLEGVADTIDETGALLVRAQGGSVRITSGVLTWL